MPLTLGDDVLACQEPEDDSTPVVASSAVSQTDQPPTSTVEVVPPVVPKVEPDSAIVVSSSDESAEAPKVIKLEPKSSRHSQCRRDMVLLSLHLSQTIAQAVEGRPLSDDERRHRTYLTSQGLLPSVLATAGTPADLTQRLTSFYEGTLHGMEDVDE